MRLLKVFAALLPLFLATQLALAMGPGMAPYSAGGGATPGGTSGQIQTNNGTGGFGALSGTGVVKMSAGTPSVAALTNSDLPASGVTAGSYTNSNVTINAQGIVTAISNGTSGGGVQVASGTLSSAQLQSINTTPVLLVAAPGAGKWLHIISISGKFNYVAPAYTGSGNLVAGLGTGSSSVQFQATIMPNGQIISTSNYWSQNAGPSTFTTLNIENEGIYATNTSGNYATGAGSVDWNIVYSVENN